MPFRRVVLIKRVWLLFEQPQKVHFLPETLPDRVDERIAECDGLLVLCLCFDHLNEPSLELLRYGFLYFLDRPRYRDLSHISQVLVDFAWLLSTFGPLYGGTQRD